MSDIKYFSADEIDAALAEIQKDWPAANWMREGYVFKIHGDAARTKFLHVDGHIY